MNTSPQKEVNNFPLSEEEEEEEEEEEGYPNHDIVNNQQDKLLSANKASSSLSTTWLTTKDPRIVRVSRGFGGKDRHSKVCTVRGLRDRRVRLSVPTAIQLYDLQDRLGLNQPSKVVDWLLNVAKDEIDELPPLPGNFINAPNNNTTSIQNWEGSSCRLTSSSTFSRARSKEVAKHQTVGVQENEAKQENQDQQVSSNSANYHAFGMLNNNNNNNSNVMSFGYHHHHHNWEPNLNNYPSTSNLGSQETPTDYHHNLNVVSAVPSNTLMSLSSSGSQFLVYGPAAGVTQSQYPNNNSLSMTRPSFHFSMNADHHHQVHSPSNNN